MSLVLAYLMMVAADAPPAPRQCGDLCRFATRPLSDMPDMTTPAAPHPERAFDAYFACATQVIARSTLSSASLDRDVDDVLLAAERTCQATRQTGTAALAAMVVASGAKNPPAEIARFADIARELLSLMPLPTALRAKMGDGRAREYFQGLRMESAPILAARSRRH